MDYAKVTLSNGDVAGVGVLPVEFVGLAADTLADLGAGVPGRGYDGFGYWPVVDQPPVHDPMIQRVTDDHQVVADPETRTVRRRPVVLALTPEELAERMAARRATLKVAVKAEAQRRIYAIAPQWKQSNMTARGVEFLMKGSANLTAAEQAEQAAGQAVWAEIKVIRRTSDQIEAAVDACDDPAAIGAWDIALGWP